MRIGLSRAVWEGSAWALRDVVRRRRGNLAELPSREARIAAIVVKYALEAGILVVVDTAPELIAIKVAVGVAKELVRFHRRAG